MNGNFFEFKNGCTFLHIRATTKASKNAISGVKNGKLSVSVTTVPEDGKANEAIIKLLSKELKCAKSKMHLVSGEKFRDKILCIDEILEGLEQLKY